jgi:hypothetical protein
MYLSGPLTEDERKMHFVKRRAKTKFQAALRRDREKVLKKCIPFLVFNSLKTKLM